MDLFSPLEAKYHCNIFFIFMVIFLIISAIGIPLMCYDTYTILKSSSKNKALATSLSLFSMVMPIAVMILYFYLYRIAYSMCVKSLKAEKDPESIEHLSMAPIIDES